MVLQWMILIVTLVGTISNHMFHASILSNTSLTGDTLNSNVEQRTSASPQPKRA